MFDRIQAKTFCATVPVVSLVLFLTVNILIWVFFASRNLSTMDAPGYNIAKKHSFGFFHDIPDEEWEMFYRRPTLDTRHYENINNPDHPTNNIHWWAMSNWNPYFHCPHMKRVGGLGDGPKWLCDPERIRRMSEERNSVAGTADAAADCLVYSIGSNGGNYRFEDGLYDIFQKGRPCEVHIFDPTNYDRPQNAQKNMHFHPWELTYSVEHKPPGQSRYVSLPEIRKLLGHEHRTIDVLKIDCDGCEWYTLKDLLSADVRQILIQTHNVPPSPSKYFDMFLHHGYVLFAKDINTWDFSKKIIDWSFLKLHPDFFCKEMDANGVCINDARWQQDVKASS